MGRDLCAGRAIAGQFRPSANCRLLIVAQRDIDLDKLMRDRAGPDSRPNRRSGAWASRTGRILRPGPGRGDSRRPVPWAGLAASACSATWPAAFPEMLEAWPQAEAGVRPGPRRPGRPRIYPHPAFTADARDRPGVALRATDVAQPALGAVSLGAWRVLQRFGVAADAFAGHSYGELVALCAARRVRRARPAPAVAAARPADGRRRAAATRGPCSPCSARRTTIERDPARRSRSTWSWRIATRRTSTVLCGSDGSNRAAAEWACSGGDCRATRLPVAAAFHSRCVAGAAVPFRDACDRSSFRQPRVPVFANTTAEPYPDDAHGARTCWPHSWPGRLSSCGKSRTWHARRRADVPGGRARERV